MGYRSDVSLMVRTEDLENFKKNNFEQYKLAFLKDIEGNTELEYLADAYTLEHGGLIDCTDELCIKAEEVVVTL